MRCFEKLLDLERDRRLFSDLERDLRFFIDLERVLRFFNDLERDFLCDLDRDRFLRDLERDLFSDLDIELFLDRCLIFVCPLVDSKSLLLFDIGFLDLTGDRDLESSLESLEDLDLRLLDFEEFCDLLGDRDRGFCDGRLADLSGDRDLDPDLLELAVLTVFEFRGDLDLRLEFDLFFTGPEDRDLE